MSRKRPPKKQVRRRARRRLPWSLLWKLLAVLLLVAAVVLVWMDAQVRQRFDAHQWQLPARVYAQPVELYSGRVLEWQHLEQMLALLRYRNAASAPMPGSYQRQGGTVLLHTRAFRDSDGGEPARQLRLTLANGRIQKVAAADGSTLPVARLEPLQVGSIHPGHSQDRILVRLGDTPQLLHDMLLAVEDRGFYEHHGVSPRGLARAVWSNLRSGGVSQGGSTLTQQLVKNFYLSQRRTIGRKLMELPMAVLLELHYEKEQILETYLNEVYLGQDGARAIHGMGLAAQFYFGRALEELEPHQLALLVGMLKGPSYYDPRRNPERAERRRNVVLTVAHEQGLLSERDYGIALERPLDVVPKGAGALYAFPAFIDLVRRQLARDYPAEVLSSEGLQIHSTLDVLAQLAAEDALGRTLRQRDADGSQQLNGAVVITAPDQGDVLAIVGDRTPRSAGFNRALDALRPIGSLAKPMVVLTALEQPKRFSLATIIDDEPLEVSMPNGQVWAPKNVDNRSMGPMPMAEALARSRNQAMARLGMDVGLQPIIATLQRLGVQGNIRPYPSLILGSHNMTPFEVAVMYQPLATGGFRTPLRAITDVLDLHGTPLARYPVSADPVVQEAPAYLTQWAMVKVMSEGTGRAAYNTLPHDLMVAGKTGTSDGLRDAWFAGFSGNHLAVVWIGRDDNQPAGVAGSSAALPVWTQVMAKLPQRSLRMDPPADVEWVWMEPDGKTRSDAGCDGAVLYPMWTPSIPGVLSACAAARQTPAGEERRGWLRRLFD